MAKDEKALSDYRAERKERLAKAAKKKNKAHGDSTLVVRIIIYVILALACLGGIAALLFYFGVPQQYLKTVKVGDTSYTYPEYNYYYVSVYQNLVDQAEEQEESYGFSIFDTSKNPSEVTYETAEDGTVTTYADYIADTVKTTLEQTAYYSELAKEQGIELNPDNQSAIDSAIEEIETYLEQYGSTYSVSRYLSLMYGKGMTVGKYKDILERQYLVSQYLEDVETKFSDEITDDDIQAKFDESPEEYKVCDIRLFGLEIPTDEETEEETEATTETATEASTEATTEAATEAITETATETTTEATTETEADATTESTTAEETTTETSENVKDTEKLAKEFESKITDEDSFVELAKQYCDEEDADKFESDSATIVKNLKYSTVNTNISEDLATWLYSSDRKEGDTTTCTTDEYVYVLYVIKPAYVNEDCLVDARHILISFDAIQSEIEASETETETDTDTDNETEDIKVETATATDGKEITNKDTGYSLDVVLQTYEKAHEVLELYAQNETEDYFAELAETYSADTGSVGDSGTSTGGLYEDIEKGEYVTNFENWVYDENRQPGDTGIIQSEYGYHIMYFVQKHAEPSWKETIRADIAAEKLEEFETTSEANYTGKLTECTWYNYANKEILKLIDEAYLSSES